MRMGLLERFLVAILSSLVLCPAAAHAQSTPVGAAEGAWRWESRESPARADKARGGLYSRTGVVIGLAFAHTGIGADLDGNKILVSSDFLVLLPKFDAAQGFAIEAGGRFGHYSGIFSFVRSAHEGRFLAEDFDAQLSSLNLDGEVAFGNTFIQPRALIGVGFHYLKMEGAAVDEASHRHDATLNGFGLNLGVGLALFPIPTFSIDLNALYRYNLFYAVNIEDANEVLSIEDGIEGQGLSIRLGVRCLLGS